MACARFLTCSKIKMPRREEARGKTGAEGERREKGVVAAYLHINLDAV